MCSVKDKINVQNFKICCCNASQTTKNTSRLQVFAIIIDVCVGGGGGGGGGRALVPDGLVVGTPVYNTSGCKIKCRYFSITPPPVVIYT